MVADELIRRPLKRSIAEPDSRLSLTVLGQQLRICADHRRELLEEHETMHLRNPEAFHRTRKA